MPEKILVVDDDPDLRSELSDFLEGYQVVEASSGTEALKLLDKANDIDLVILDVNMPGPSGTDVLMELRKTDPDLGIIILTGHSSKEVAIEALKGRADDYLEKPLDIARIKEVIEKVLEKKRGGGEISSNDIKGKIEKVKRFVERNTFKKTTLKDAAEAICLSTKYLSRIFKETTGMSFSEYRLKIKTEGAKQLLLKSGYNINQISDKLGYENVESFIRMFKRFTGLTPREYRDKEKIKKKKKAQEARRKKKKNS